MRIRNKSLNYYLLLALENAIDGCILLDDFINNTHAYAYGSERVIQKSELSQAIKRLRERGLIETKIDEGKIVMSLTELGSDAIGLVKTDEPWDGLWRIVIYDIPENKRQIRDLFRRRLKDWGFKYWQQSIWVTKSNITIKLRKLLDKLGIKDWVVVIESNDPAISNIISTPV